MSLDHATVRRIARLARIEATDSDIESYVGEINNILRWVGQLDELDTEGVPPLTGVVAMDLPRRADVVAEGGLRDEILANAPHSGEGYFIVPKVVE